MFLIPLALKGVKPTARSAPAAELLRRNVLIYGVGGLIVPFVGIKVIDLAAVGAEPSRLKQSQASLHDIHFHLPGRSTRRRRLRGC